MGKYGSNRGRIEKHNIPPLGTWELVNVIVCQWEAMANGHAMRIFK